MNRVNEAPWFRRLLTAIEQSGMSYRAISLKAGISHTYVAQLVTEHKMPSVEKMLEICEALDVSPIRILTGADVDPEALEMVKIFSRLTVDQQNSILSLMQSMVRLDDSTDQKPNISA